MIFIKTFLLILVCYVQPYWTAKILGVFPVPSISHQVVFRALNLELAKRGHELTIITTDPIPDPPPKYYQVDVHNVSYSIWNKPTFADHGVKQLSLEKKVDEIGQALAEVLYVQLRDPLVQDVLKQTNAYDLLIIEAAFPMAYGYAHLIKAPYIGITSYSGLDGSYKAVGSPTHPLFYPDVMNNYQRPKTLYEKLIQVYEYFYLQYYMHWAKRDETHQFMQACFGSDVPYFTNIEKNVDLLILNHYPLITGIRPLVPAIVYTGGLHIQPRKPLPKEMQQLLDDSKRGVIYVSFGSNVRSKDLPTEIIQTFLHVFSKMPYTIIWKFEDDDLPGKPNNVYIFKWLPQYDLLGHPNIKLFIMQGGQQSLEESVHSGVPLIGIPFIGDQPLNVDKIRHLNIGLGLNIATLTRESLEYAIRKVIDDPSFKSNVTTLGELIKDEPLSSLERAVWWIEYVIRHKGAKHLRSPVIETTWVEYFMLDVAAVLIAGVIIILFIFAVTMKVLVNLIKKATSNKNHKDVSKKKR